MGSSAPPPPYYDWMTVPDTSQLPPPPGIHYSGSAANATRDEAERAHGWTAANRLWPARQLEFAEAEALSIGFASLIRPPEFAGTVEPLRQAPGKWRVSTARGCPDSCFTSNVPLYSALLGAPRYGRKQVAYFEVVPREMAADSGVAVGFAAAPYPTWRLPGWERASLAVHGDDGRKYVNDTWGGVDFTHAFQPGEVVGIGVEFGEVPQSDKRARPEDVPVRVFFTRGGALERSWDLHEQVDARMDQPGGVTGLQGTHDLYAAIGVYGACEFEVCFARHNWRFRPSE